MSQMGSTIDRVITAVVGFLLIGYVGPTALLSMVNATGFTAGGTLATLFNTVLPIIGIIVFLLIIVDVLRSRGK